MGPFLRFRVLLGCLGFRGFLGFRAFGPVFFMILRGGGLLGSGFWGFWGLGLGGFWVLGSRGLRLRV